MTKTDTIRQAMMEALKNKDKPRKDSLSMLLSALKAKAIDKREPLTPEEEDAVILKEIKQAQETIDTAPAGREAIAAEAEARIAVYKEFAPKQMDEAEIRAVILETLRAAGIDSPTAAQKGLVMKTIMPALKGKADGAVINKIVGEMLA